MHAVTVHQYIWFASHCPTGYPAITALTLQAAYSNVWADFDTLLYLYLTKPTGLVPVIARMYPTCYLAIFAMT
jgi:hypothetical protein